MKINSVLGQIDTAQLGQTLVHEHISCADWSLRMNFSRQFFDYKQIKDLAVLRLQEAKEIGVSTVVDGTPINLGRDIELIRDAAEGSGINIIVSSGFYYQYEPSLAHRSRDQIKRLLLQECTQGINGTGILPGILKAGVEGPVFTDYNQKLLQATGETAAETGLPIFCHTDPKIKSGEDAFKILNRCGVPEHRIILGHSGDCDDIDYLEHLLETGAWLGMDRFAATNDVTLSFERRSAAVIELCRRGWSERLLLSHDAAVYLAFFDYWDRHKKQIEERSCGTYTRIHQKLFPAMLKEGIAQETINSMLIDNPKKLFEAT